MRPLRWCAAGLVLLAAGCAFGPRVPTEEERAEFGDVAVVVAPGNAEISFAPPPAGWAEGLGKGTLRGLAAIVVLPAFVITAIGPQSGGEFGALVVLSAAAVGAAVGVAYTPISMAAGAATAASTEEVEAAAVAVRRFVDDADGVVALRERVVDAMRSRTGRESADPANAATWLEVRLVRLEHGKTTDTFSVNCAFSVSVEVAARVVRRSDNAEIWSGTQKRSGSGAERTYVDWAADDASALRAEVADATRNAADWLVWTIFVAPQSESPSSWTR